MERILLLIFTFSIEAIILWQYSASLFAPVRPGKIRTSLLCAFYIALFLISLFGISWLNVATYFLVNLVFLFTQFQVGFMTAFFHSALITAIMGITELSVFAITTRVLPTFLTDKGIGLFFYTVLSKILYFTVIYFLIHLFRGKTAIQAQHSRSDSFLMMIPVASVVIMLTFFLIGQVSPFTPPLNILVVVSASLLLVVNLLVFGISQYNQKKSKEFTEMQILLQKESDSAAYYEMLLAQNESQNILLHDIKRHLQSISILLEDQKTEKAAAYIRQLLDSSDLKEASRICDNDMLNAILCRYQRQCLDRKVAFHADIRKGAVQDIPLRDLTSLFCNLLDNALEAAENVPDGFIELSVQHKDPAPILVIILINSCRARPEFDENGLPITQKADGKRHGFGVKSIEKVVKQYQGNLQMYYKEATGTFHTILALKLQI